ncbi:hypothetical protein [Streptomyces netropsis]|uniref:Uncharacterized protein n=1 Tax=Streptomyces netropsis TaxID=55404 RepID=A0A7W7PFR2_STRNE|nr:hypothetical protein [Streptomyces netropsis]MBB4888032.1 hypothetical protein [Streptomyces netropsis]GGR32521.1 hypothetical protein GCM10010219_41720 [Streptomyces netropsis]
MPEHARIVVHPPSPSGGRQVTVGREVLGMAYGVIDLYEFLRRTGVSMEDARLDDPALIDWQGGGPGVWS